MPVGHNITTAAKDSVKLDGVKLKLDEKKARWKSLVGIHILLSKILSEGVFSGDERSIPWNSGSPHICFPCGVLCYLQYRLENYNNLKCYHDICTVIRETLIRNYFFSVTRRSRSDSGYCLTDSLSNG